MTAIRTRYLLACALGLALAVFLAPVAWAYEPAGESAADAATANEEPANLMGATVAPVSDSVYTGYPVQPSPAITYDGKLLTPGIDFNYVWPENSIDTGMKVALAQGRGAYEGSRSFVYQITPAPISACRISGLGSRAYEGAPIEQNPIVIYNGKMLLLDRDYTLSFADNTDVGTATVTIEGKGNFEGQIQESFEITESVGTWIRRGGANRYETMARIAETGFAGTSGYAVLATGANFPDALSASALAGAYECPVILTSPHQLSAQAQAQLERLATQRVLIMGGAGAVSAEVEQAVAGMGIATTRIAGGNRQGTSIAAYRAFWSAKGGMGYDTVVIASGRNFPDALSIGPYSYAHSAPILLAASDGTLSSDAYVAIVGDRNIRNVVLVGGTSVVSDDIRRQLGSSYNYIRLGGQNRYETSVVVAEWELQQGMQSTHPAVATGRNFPDALAGAALCGKNNSPILLVDDANRTAITRFVAPHGSQVINGFVFGGTGVVSEGTYNTLSALTAR